MGHNDGCVMYFNALFSSGSTHFQADLSCCVCETVLQPGVRNIHSNFHSASPFPLVFSQLPN